MDQDEFVEKFSNIIEHLPLIAASLVHKRPFSSVDHFHQLISSFLDQLPQEGKMGVLRLHPDLAGRLAEMGHLTGESQAEQKAAGLDTLTEEEREQLKENNRKYKTKFTFPFVIVARENKKDAILKGLALRLENSASEELETGLGQVKKIGLLRLLNIISQQQKQDA